MEDLIKAINVRLKYNKMDFDDFIKELEEYLGKEFDKKIKDDWIFTGLNNVDFITMYVDF